MKTLKTLFLAIAILASYSINAQVAINTDGSSADGSAMLEVKSTDKGFLPPRMTEAERQSWGSNDAAGAFGSGLKLPVAGYREYSFGSLSNVGYNGFYWSSTVDGNGTNSGVLHFYSSNAGIVNGFRASGFSVRCIKD